MRGTGALAAVLAVPATCLALAGCGGSADVSPAGSPSAGAVLPGGGLSVAEALATDAEPPLAVAGWVVGSGGDARLCSTYDASADVPCGEPSLALEGDVEGMDGKGVSLLGAVEGDTFVVSSTVQG